MLRTHSGFATSSQSAHSPTATCWAPFAQRGTALDDIVQITIHSETATLTDLVRLAQLAITLPGAAVLLAERIRIGCWQKSLDVRLYFSGALARRREPLQPAETAAIAASVELARKTIVQLLQTTCEQNPLPNDKVPAARILKQYRQGLERSRRPQTVASFISMVRVASEGLHRAHAAQLLWVRVQAPQSPTECLLHWLNALRTAQETLTGQADPWLHQTEILARRRWMQHDLTLASVRSYFAQMQLACIEKSAPELAALAAQLAASLPTEQQGKHFSARLNDNLYGRVFETRLVANLITTPAPGTLIFAQQLATSLLHLVSALPPSVRSLIAKALTPALLDAPRFWFDRVPKLVQFITAQPGEPKKSALVNWLSTPPQSGYDCMAIMVLACQLSLLLNQMTPKSAPWMEAANINYRQIVQPSARRLKNRAEPILRPEGGILLLHQRPAFSHPAMRLGRRATLHHRPNLDTPSAAIRCALEHGLPYASGVSGSTNILLHQAHFFRQRGIELDSRHLLLAAMMLLNGGHSLHEVLWMAHQLDGPLGLGLSLADVAPEEFVSDYDRFIALFDGADRTAIERAVNAAWDETIDYARFPRSERC